MTSSNAALTTRHAIAREGTRIGAVTARCPSSGITEQPSCRTVGWGRQLRSVQVEFYDRFDVETDAEHVDPREVTRSQVAFRVAVMDRAFRRTSGWALLEVVPLSEKEEAAVYRSFKQDPGGALSIYFEKPDGSLR